MSSAGSFALFSSFKDQKPDGQWFLYSDCEEKFASLYTMGESNRQRKFSSLLTKELAEVFQRDTPHLFANAFITITRVHISPDLGMAKVHLSFMLVNDKEELLEKINSHKGELRKLLGQRIRREVRIIPDLVFFLDEGAEYAQQMDTLINKLDIPDPSSDEEDTDD